MLVSQLAHESGHFSTLSENLNYSVEALRTGNRAKYFTQLEARICGYIKTAQGYYSQRADQKMIANLYYGSRLGNRGENTDDGWNFRGSGLIQLTGRSNILRFGLTVNKTPEEAAEYCRTPEGAVASALWYWRSNKLLVPASKGDVTLCTMIIQGADGSPESLKAAGITSRISLFKAALSNLG
jgi:putative chitinase